MKTDFVILCRRSWSVADRRHIKHKIVERRTNYWVHSLLSLSVGYLCNMIMCCAIVDFLASGVIKDSSCLKNFRFYVSQSDHGTLNDRPALKMVQKCFLL